MNEACDIEQPVSVETPSDRAIRSTRLFPAVKISKNPNKIGSKIISLFSLQETAFLSYSNHRRASNPTTERKQNMKNSTDKFVVAILGKDSEELDWTIADDEPHATREAALEAATKVRRSAREDGNNWYVTVLNPGESVPEMKVAEVRDGDGYRTEWQRA